MSLLTVIDAKEKLSMYKTLGGNVSLSELGVLRLGFTKFSLLSLTTCRTANRLILFLRREFRRCPRRSNNVLAQ